ncbi:MAG TPA: DNA cytosine methyltransferase [Polyangia bacterium]
MAKPQAIDLFSGAGGLSVGLVSAGFDVAAGVERDTTSAHSYQLNHRKTPVVVADIRAVRGQTLLDHAGLKPGELALLTGCPPCQGFSTLRTKRQVASSEDDRNDLIFEVLRLLRSIRPMALILENVPGLANDQRFARFRQGLLEAGYISDFALVDAADFGVPQRRRRLVLMALRGRTVPEGWATPGTGRTTVRETIGRLPRAGASGDVLHDWPERRSEIMMARIRATPPDGGSRADILMESLKARCHTRTDGYSDVYGRMSWNDVAPTITSGCHNPSKGRFLHPTFDRAITLREAALLQTFPPKYRFAIERGKEHIAMQIGNAFPPRLIRPFANVIRRELGL